MTLKCGLKVWKIQPEVFAQCTTDQAKRNVLEALEDKKWAGTQRPVNRYIRPGLENCAGPPSTCTIPRKRQRIRFEDFKKVSPPGWDVEMWELEVLDGSYLLQHPQLSKEVWLADWTGQGREHAGFTGYTLTEIIELINQHYERRRK